MHFFFTYGLFLERLVQVLSALLAANTVNALKQVLAQHCTAAVSKAPQKRRKPGFRALFQTQVKSKSWPPKRQKWAKNSKFHEFYPPYPPSKEPPPEARHRYPTNRGLFRGPQFLSTKIIKLTRGRPSWVASVVGRGFADRPPPHPRGWGSDWLAFPPKVGGWLFCREK